MTGSFFMVFAECGNSPTCRHATYDSALAEAKRLASGLNTKTWVLEAVTKVEKTQFQITELVDRKTDDLPF